MALTARQIEQAKPADKPYKLADSSGLYLYVAPSGLKSWRKNYSCHGRQATATFGRFPAMSLAEARRANAMFSAPARKKVPTFTDVFEDWVTRKTQDLSNPKHKHQIEETMRRYVLPRIGPMPIDSIPRASMVDVVRAVDAEGKTETAHRIAGRIRMVFDYAVDVGALKEHSAAGLTRTLSQRKTQRNMPCVHHSEVSHLLAAIDTYSEEVTRLGLLLVAHVFVRSKEVRLLQWDWVNWKERVIVFPDEVMKMDKPHVVPMSRQVEAILKELEKYTGDCQHVLASPTSPSSPISENTLLFALYRLGYRGRMTVHGFRALASTVLNERSSFRKDAIERQLAHKESDEVRAAYNRADYFTERCEMLQWWSDWLDSQRPAPGQNDASE